MGIFAVNGNVCGKLHWYVCNLPMKWVLPDVFLNVLMDLEPPTICKYIHCPIVHIMRMIWPFTVSHFDLPVQSYGASKSKVSKFLQKCHI